MDDLPVPDNDKVETDRIRLTKRLLIFPKVMKYSKLEDADKRQNYLKRFPSAEHRRSAAYPSRSKVWRDLRAINKGKKVCEASFELFGNMKISKPMAKKATYRDRLGGVLKQETKNRDLVFGGLGRNETKIPMGQQLDPTSPIYDDLIIQRWTALCEFYGIDLDNPDEGWRLAACLAIEFLPNFQVKLPNSEKAHLSVDLARADRLAARLTPPPGYEEEWANLDHKGWNRRVKQAKKALVDEMADEEAIISRVRKPGFSAKKLELPIYKRLYNTLNQSIKRVGLALEANQNKNPRLIRNNMELIRQRYNRISKERQEANVMAADHAERVFAIARDAARSVEAAKACPCDA